jgi:hypothetical protein
MPNAQPGAPAERSTERLITLLRSVNPVATGEYHAGFCHEAAGRLDEYEKKISDLEETERELRARVADLQAIERDHRILNAKLRVEAGAPSEFDVARPRTIIDRRPEVCPAPVEAFCAWPICECRRRAG